MTDAAPRRRSRARWLPVLAVVVAVAVGGIAWLGGDDPEPNRDEALPPVAVASDAPRLASLQQLVAGSDLIVRARVVRTERGRVFGDPGGGSAIESRVVTLEVVRVLGGTDRPEQRPAAGDRLRLEEEGWTLEGAPLVVDGLGPSREGDDAIWFLTGVGTDEEARYVVVSAEGRYLVDGDELTGADGDDPLIRDLEGLGAAGLEAAVTAPG